MVIGVTGGIGSGKSTIVKEFQKLANVAVYMADDEAKKLMNSSEKIRKQICEKFGDMAYQNNTLNRAYLAKIVFTDKEKLTQLNAIVHPEVYTHFKTFVESNKDKDFVLYENAILFENGSDILCDKIITIVTDLEERIARVMKRDNVTKQDVEHRIQNQWSDLKKGMLSNYIIYNNESDEVQNQIIRIHNNLTK